MDIGWLGASSTVAVLLTILSGGCGTLRRSPGGAARGQTAVRDPHSTAGLPPDGDGDSDNPKVTGVDNDDRPPGQRPAATNDRSAILASVRRYYAAAAAGRGAVACSLLVSAEARAVPEDYGRPPGPPSLRGRTCSAVLSKLFAQRHRELVERRSSRQVRAVLVGGGSGSVFMRFGKSHAERSMFLRRQHGAWRISGVLDIAVL